MGGQASRTTYDYPSGSVEAPASWAPEVGVGLSLGRRVLRQKFTFRAELHYVRQVAEASSSEVLFNTSRKLMTCALPRPIYVYPYWCAMRCPAPRCGHL